jgi:hypothetical protein
MTAFFGAASLHNLPLPQMRPGPGKPVNRNHHRLPYNFMKPTYIIMAAVFFSLALAAEWGERKSRRWYRDRNLLRASGFCVALGLVMVACAIAL